MIWEDVMEYGKHCGLIAYEKILPIYLCSIGAHIANLHNRGIIGKAPFYTHRGQVPDVRIHIMAVGPPGYGKSLYSRLFVEETYGLLIGAIPCVRQGKLTAKGLVGGFEGEERIVGEAEVYWNGVIGIEEFDHIVQAGKQDHSGDIENDLLDLMDSGHYRSRKGTKEAIDYYSYFTLYAGTQPERFKIAGGLGRRAAFLDQIPDDNVRRILFESHYGGMGIEPDMEKVRNIRDRIAHFYTTFNPTKIIMTEEYQKMTMSLATDHLELAYLDKFAIGYRAIRFYRGGRELFIEPDQELYELLKIVRLMRIGCMYGATELAVLKLLENPKELTKFKIEGSRKLHMSYKALSDAVKNLLDDGIIVKEAIVKPGTKKPITVLSKNRLLEQAAK